MPKQAKTDNGPDLQKAEMGEKVDSRKSRSSAERRQRKCVIFCLGAKQGGPERRFV